MDNFSFLEQCKELEHIAIELKDVEETYIISKMQLDLSRFEELELFSGEYKYICNLNQAKKLKSLRLNDYTETMMTDLAELSELDTLELNMSKLKSLEGRKHYNLKDSKLPKGKYVGGNENIEMWRRFE